MVENISMIEVEHLTKKYNHTLAVDDISFTIEKGEIVGFLGPNGAGKTTTLRVLTGYFPPTSGTCKIAGFNIEESPVEAKTQIGYLPENNPLYNEMKVVEFLEFVGTLRKLEAPKNRIKEVASTCGIKNVMVKNIGELSKGYRQRVGLAQAILHNPDILIMDEPTEGLDPNQIVEVRELIRELGKEKTVVISTHRLAEVEAICKRVLIINKGKLVANAGKEELYQASKGKTVIELQLKGPKAGVLEQLKAIPNIENIKLTKQVHLGEEGDLNSYEIETKGASDPREQLFNTCANNKWAIMELHLRLSSLEDVFRELTQEA